jgi:hypothetical protein
MEVHGESHWTRSIGSNPIRFSLALEGRKGLNKGYLLLRFHILSYIWHLSLYSKLEGHETLVEETKEESTRANYILIG